MTSISFCVSQAYWEDQGGMFASNQTLTSHFVGHFKDLNDEYQSATVELSQLSHNCGAHGIFSDARYNSSLNYPKDEIAFEESAIVSVVTELGEKGLAYNPDVDQVYFGHTSTKSEDGEAGQYYCWNRRLSVRPYKETILKYLKTLTSMSEPIQTYEI